MLGIIEIALITFLALLPISNPFSSVPLFLSLTKGHTREWSNQQALMASVFMAGILLTFLWSGAIIIEFFGISIPAIRVAGGLIIMKVGFGMLNPKETEELSDEIKEESKTKSDISFTPLAMPSLAGPGSISVVISMAAGSDNLPGYVAISLGVLMVVLVAYLSMRGAPYISKVLGVTGLDALTRIMGFILICVAFQFVLDGIGGYIESEKFLKPILEQLQFLTT
ncbi:MarC family NAAT transporter [Flammeovirga sp. EKP202]|uniref:MarC family NAAT transporter n=1 Tax=Flammeovirga sp. EKP202 TaxID=2770592 RepID=UPI00165FFDAB|nr:MarC family NAAT transporter [Flammeovirga sp. EKP202]MBD0399948.1 MarC family NAAT transporter [Flammeovirga sp. EKP202]